MRLLERALYRLLLLAFPRRVRREFGSEMEQMLIDQLDDARRRRASVTRIWASAAVDALQYGFAERSIGAPHGERRDRVRSRRWRFWVHAFRQDVRYALRLLVQQPGISLVAVLTLALGIGANTAIFSAVNAVLLRPLPYPAADRLVMVWEKRHTEGVLDNVVSPADFLDWSQMHRSFSAIAGMTAITADLTGAGEPVRLSAGGGLAAILRCARRHPSTWPDLPPGGGHRRTAPRRDSWPQDLAGKVRQRPIRWSGRRSC